jgi:hypothetical protein
MKTTFILLTLVISVYARSQELYPSTEPASNMSTKAIGLRFKTDFYPAYSHQIDGVNYYHKAMYRVNPELMWGASKNWMLHADLFAANIHQNSFKFEGGSFYAKYRFLSSDQVQSHLRMALYGRASLIDNPIEYREINLSGDNSGFGGGLVVTQLIHKIALSVTGGYLVSLPNISSDGVLTNDAFNYSFSAGYLFLPFHYRNYIQPNVNLYMEILCKSNPASGENYVDAAPAVQLIVNSIMRFDLIYEKQLSGNMDRSNDQSFSVRLEFNFLNAYK